MYGFEDRKPQRIVDLLSDQIRREILSGVLAPQTELSLVNLQQEFGGHKEDILKALQLLCDEELTAQLPSGAFHVVKPNETDVVELIEMRADIECSILARSMEKGNIHWHGLLQSAQNNLLEALTLAKSNFETYASSLEENNKAFHQSLAAACDLEDLNQQQLKLYQQTYRFRVTNLRDNSQRLNVINDMVNALVDAIIDNDSQLAQRLLKRFISFNLP